MNIGHPRIVIDVVRHFRKSGSVRHYIWLVVTHSINISFINRPYVIPFTVASRDFRNQLTSNTNSWKKHLPLHIRQATKGRNKQLITRIDRQKIGYLVRRQTVVANDVSSIPGSGGCCWHNVCHRSPKRVKILCILRIDFDIKCSNITSDTLF